MGPIALESLQEAVGGCFSLTGEGLNTKNKKTWLPVSSRGGICLLKVWTLILNKMFASQ